MSSVKAESTFTYSGDGGWSHDRRTLLHSLSSRREGISFWAKFRCWDILVEDVVISKLSKSKTSSFSDKNIPPIPHHPLSSEVLAVTKNRGLHDFTFDAVFGERSGQPKVYEEAARRLVMEFLNGTSASIICCSIFLKGRVYCIV